MIKCSVCKSKMPAELFIPSFPRVAKGNVCPICTHVLINIRHGIDIDIMPLGEEALRLIEEAKKYYKLTIKQMQKLYIKFYK